jgi:hypothetical protein
MRPATPAPGRLQEVPNAGATMEDPVTHRAIHHPANVPGPQAIPNQDTDTSAAAAVIAVERGDVAEAKTARPTAASRLAQIVRTAVDKNVARAKIA